MVEKIPNFTEINYVTSDGENCSATKNNGVVTIRGDKNGVRQMPLEQFLPQFVKDQAAKGSLERTPSKDTVSFNGGIDTEPSKGKNLLVATLVAVPLVIGAVLIGRGKGAKNVVKQAEKKGAEIVEDAAKATKKQGMGIADDVAKVTEKKGAGTAEGIGCMHYDAGIPEFQKGIYGQDIYDPLEPMNKLDILSPYYEDPCKGIYDNLVNDPFGPDNFLGL